MISEFLILFRCWKTTTILIYGKVSSIIKSEDLFTILLLDYILEGIDLIEKCGIMVLNKVPVILLNSTISLLS